MRSEDEKWMKLALSAAKGAALAGEIPVGAALVRQGELLALGQNRREALRSPLGHAEIEAIEAGCRTLGSWRLEGCTLYVTLEPCAMCAGAILNARIGRVVYGAREPKTGCCGSVADLFAMPWPHQVYCSSGVLAEECQALLTEFFEKIRQRQG